MPQALTQRSCHGRAAARGHIISTSRKGEYQRELREAREELAALVEYMLRVVTGDGQALMWWSNRAYWTEVVCRYKVAVFEWPSDIQFAGPFQVSSSLNVISRLLFGWRKGQIYFRKLTPEEFLEKRSILEPLAEADRRASQLCRAQRSDLGDTRPLRPVETRGKRRRAKSGLHSERYIEGSDIE